MRVAQDATAAAARRDWCVGEKGKTAAVAHGSVRDRVRPGHTTAVVQGFVDLRGAQYDRLRSLRELLLLLCLLLVFLEPALKPVNRRLSSGASFFGDTVRDGLPEERTVV